MARSLEAIQGDIGRLMGELVEHADTNEEWTHPLEDAVSDLDEAHAAIGLAIGRREEFDEEAHRRERAAEERYEARRELV